jgi:hypothetical protein
VQCVENLNAVFEEANQVEFGDRQSFSCEGRFEEYKALRSEMLEIIKGRIWGQATYTVLAVGLLTSKEAVYIAYRFIFIIAVSLPFLFYTIQREHSRIRMANYLRLVLEPKIPGMNWEHYLRLWRGKFGKAEGKGWLNVVDRLKHIFCYSGVYLMISIFCFVLLLIVTKSLLLHSIGGGFFIALVVTYYYFFKMFDKEDKRGEELVRLWPKDGHEAKKDLKEAKRMLGEKVDD